MEYIIYIAAFLLIAVASKEVSQLFLRIKLPLITGLLVIGIMAGPFVLNMIPAAAIAPLDFLNDFSLAFIAFAAGAELYLKELRNRLHSIAWNTFGQLVVTFVLGSVAVFALSDYIPFMADLDVNIKVAISILAGTIFVARSPSSAIAIINELRAKGPFTQTALGVTVVKDVLVIMLFALCFSIAEALVIDKPFHFSLILIIFAEITTSLALGFGLAKVLELYLSFNIRTHAKTILILATGLGIFLGSSFFRDWTAISIGHGIYFEPLLICIVASFAVTNYSNYRVEFHKILDETGPMIYVVFFTYTGAAMSLDILRDVWAVALLLFFVRLIAMIIGAAVGGTLANDPKEFRAIGWMPYVTQAGVGLGLATQVEGQFTSWGPEFATVIIATIVLNQIVGPPFFKWSINKVGEAHFRATTPNFDGIRDAIIFGLESQSIALARQLMNNGWEVKIATRVKQKEDLDASDLDIRYFEKFDMAAMDEMKANLSEAMVLMLSDEDNYLIFEMVYENVGTRDMIVRLNDRKNFERFHELGALIVEPATAIVSLLDHFVRSPQAASLLLGMEKDQDTVDLEVINPNLHGASLRDLHLPTDIIILSIKRKGQMLISHGFTRLRRGDIVTLVGSVESLKNVTLRFDG